MDDQAEKVQDLMKEVEQLRQRVQELQSLELLQQKAEEELLKFNFELTAVYMAIPDTVLRVNSQNVITDCKTNLPYHWDALAADPHPPDWYHPNLAAHLQAEIETVRQSGQEGMSEYMVQRTPEPCWYEVRTFAFLQDQVIVVLRDISAQKQAEERSTLLEEERRITELLQKFIVVIAHDFKTPLTIIQNSADLMVRISDPQRQLHHANTITGQVARLTRMIDNFLIMTRVETVSQLTLTTGSINALTSGIHSRYQPLAEARNLRFVYAPADRLESVPMDRNQLLIAIEKLVENALFYTPANGEIRLSTFRDGPDAVIEVCDTGIGVSTDDLPLIFDRFFRADRARSLATGENGLGLTIARRIVELHGGAIHVTSTEGSGSCFRIRIPVPTADGPLQT